MAFGFDHSGGDTRGHGVSGAGLKLRPGRLAGAGGIEIAQCFEVAAMDGRQSGQCFVSPGHFCVHIGMSINGCVRPKCR